MGGRTFAPAVGQRAPSPAAAAGLRPELCPLPRSRRRRSGPGRLPGRGFQPSAELVCRRLQRHAPAHPLGAAPCRSTSHRPAPGGAAGRSAAADGGLLQPPPSRRAGPPRSPATDGLGGGGSDRRRTQQQPAGRGTLPQPFAPGAQPLRLAGGPARPAPRRRRRASQRWQPQQPDGPGGGAPRPRPRWGGSGGDPLQRRCPCVARQGLARDGPAPLSAAGPSSGCRWAPGSGAPRRTAQRPGALWGARDRRGGYGGNHGARSRGSA